MFNHDILSGTPVLVRPGLTYDPAGRKNEIGVIVNYDIGNDSAIVGFQDNTSNLFASDALLVLLPESEIHRNISEMSYKTPREDWKSMAEIIEILMHGIGDTKWGALEIARDNKNIQLLCTRTLEESLGIKRGRGL